MYTNKAYLNNSLIDIKDKTKPLIVTSCGTYKLYTRSVFYTLRPKGRIDFQLLYIVSGKAHFHFNGKETIVHAGHMVLYRPKEPQQYEYYAEDQTEVYWVHFTGSNVTNLLRSYGLTNDKKFFLRFQSGIPTTFSCDDKRIANVPGQLSGNIRNVFTTNLYQITEILQNLLKDRQCSCC